MEQCLIFGLAVAAVAFATFMIVTKQIYILSKNKGEVCYTSECVQSASSIFGNMDPTVNPCDDFYRFTCGKYLNREYVPDGELRIGNFMTLSKKVEGQLKEIVGKSVSSKDLHAFKTVKNYYQACLDEEHISEEGVEPIKKILDHLGGWPVLLGRKWSGEKFSWTELMYKFTNLGYPNNVFFNVGLGALIKNNSRIIIFINRAPTSLLNTHAGLNNSIVQSYYKHMVNVASKFGANHTTAHNELKHAVEFELKLSNISSISRSVVQMSIQELDHSYPSIPWTEYLKNFLSPHATLRKDEKIYVAEPRYFHDLEELLNKTQKRVLANYALWKLIDMSAPFVTKDIQQKRTEPKKRKNLNVFKNFDIIKSFELNVGPAEPSRWRRCLGLVGRQLTVGTSAMYVRNYVDKKLKAKSTELVNDIRTVFRNILVQVDWMDVPTKKHALEKADLMGSHVAYPNELFDDKKLDDYYSSLQVHPKQYLRSMLNVSLLERKWVISQYAKRIKKSAWQKHSFSTTVNAFNYPLQNSMEFPAAILQEPFFNSNRPQYMNYGAIGFVIGHEITHGFDNIGSRFDKNGNFIDWWTKESKEHFSSKARCIAQQYGHYKIAEINKTINGTKTLGENIADIGSAKIMFKAYDQWAIRHGAEPKLPGLNFTNRQMMWISLGNMWCEKSSKDFMKQLISIDPHSPGLYRVIGSVSNSRDFAKDFNCPLGSNMNPVEKCVLW